MENYEELKAEQAVLPKADGEDTMVKEAAVAEAKANALVEAMADVQMAAADERTPIDETQGYPEAPYFYNVAGDETVALNDGTLQYSVTDFSLPGRNGFDLLVARQFDSRAANRNEASVGYDAEYNVKTFERTHTHFQRMYGLGYGWQFVLPSIEIVPETEWKEYVTYKPTLHLQDGRAFELNGTALKDYTMKDITVTLASGKVTHPQRNTETRSYHVTVSYKNGTKDYFQKIFNAENKLLSYKLVARQDRFGNTICYTMTDNGGMKIVDSWGRDIALVKTVAAPVTTMVWTLPGGETVKYKVEGGALTETADPLGRKTQYTYYDSSVYLAKCKLFESETSTISIRYQLLKTITHPTGAVTQYEYISPDKPTGTLPTPLTLMLIANNANSYRGHFPLMRRLDSADGKSYNTTRYEYTRAANKKYVERADVTMLNGISERHTFNSKGQLTEKRIMHYTQLVKENVYLYGTDKAKADYKLLLSEESKQYGPDSTLECMHKIAKTEYTSDKLANVAKNTEEYPGEPALNREASMTYGPYSTLLTKTYKRNAESTLREEYVLRVSPDNKVVEYQLLYENDLLQAKTQMVYGVGNDDKYCVTEERRYFTEEGHNLAFSNQYLATLYTYSAATFTHQPVTKQVSGLADVDGTACAPWVERYEYDLYGRALRTTNANGAVSDTQYDILGRVLRQYTPAAEPGAERACKSNLYDDARNTLTTTDEGGYKKRFEYTPFGKIARVYLAGQQGVAGQADLLLTQCSYDEEMRLTNEIAYTGEGSAAENIKTMAEYTYDQYGRLLTKSIPQGEYREVHTYDDVCMRPDASDGPCFEHIKTLEGESPAQNLVQATYTNQLGQLMAEFALTLEEGVFKRCRTAAYTYDMAGNKTSQAAANGAVTRWVYDYAGRQVSVTRTLNGQAQTSTTHYDTLGNKIYSVDFAGHKTKLFYDALGRLLKQVSPFDARSAVTKYYYDAVGSLTAQKIYAGSSWRESTYRYDACSRQTDVYVYENEDRSQWNRTQTLYNLAGNKVEVRTGLTHASSGYAATRYTYDRFGNTLTVQDPMGMTEHYKYDKIGLLQTKTDRTGVETHYQYDAMGHVVRKWASAPGQSSELSIAYNRLGQKTKEIAWEARNGQPARAVAQSYEYDGRGRLVLQRDTGGIVKRFAYNPSGSRKSFTLCKADILLYGSALSATEYDELRLTAAAYDAMRIEASEYDMYGVQYGGLGGTTFGLTAKQYDDTGLKAMEYDALNLTAQEYDLFPPSVYEGLTTKVEIDLFYGYDELERLVAVHREGPAGQLLAKYEYDANGNRSRVRVPYNGLETRYTYNKANLPIRLENLKNGVCLSGWEAHYSPDGNKVAEAELPGTNPLTAAEYDGYGLTAQGYDGKAVHALDYDQNAKVVLGYSTAPTAPVVYYQYDKLGRLAQEARAGWNTIRYEYDRFHNRIKMTVTGEEKYETAYEYDANNRLLKTVKTGSWAGVNSKTETGTYSYDANGSQLRRETQKAAGGQETELREYNGFGQLTAVRTEKMVAEYSYRPDGLRHGKTVDGIATTHHWNGQDMVMESGATGFVKARYLRGINLLAQQIDGRLYAYLFNLHGDVVQRVAENGDAAPRYEYDAFGNQRKGAGTSSSPDTDPNPFRYCGEYFDGETGEVYLRARYYNTGNGRFGSDDPARAGLNWYTYCNGNPVNLVDPSGLRPDDPIVPGQPINCGPYRPPASPQPVLWPYGAPGDQMPPTSSQPPAGGGGSAPSILNAILDSQYPTFAPPTYLTSKSSFIGQGFAGIPAMIADGRMDSALDKIEKNKEVINKVGAYYDIPPDLIASIILKEQYTQSIPDFAIIALGLIGHKGSVGLGAIRPETARNAWNHSYPDIAITDDNIVLQQNLSMDAEANIETIALVLRYEADNAGFGSISSLSEADTKNLLSYYNGGYTEITPKTAKYGAYTQAYMPYMSTFLQ